MLFRSDEHPEKDAEHRRADDGNLASAQPREHGEDDGEGQSGNEGLPLSWILQIEYPLSDFVS